MNSLYQRKINYSALVVVMLLGMTACGGGSGANTSQQNDKATVNVTVKVLK